jgi:LDH2 family malate/lactate/ureidoglycolate dehydrogenase
VSNDDRIRVQGEALKVFCTRVFQKLGVREEDARIAADVVVAADLRGIESHGTARLRRFYTDKLQEGVIVPTPQFRVLKETFATALMDGGRGLGQPTAYRAMELAIKKACQVGAGFVTVCNSTHFGIAGYYSMMALESGCIGLSMTNGSPWVVPTFGRRKMLGTNAISVAVPSGQGRPFVLDMATSTASLGKLEVRERLGRPIPLGWATDETGNPTTDPRAVLPGVGGPGAGGLLPLGGAGEEYGGHKGYGLAMWVEIFSALLSGARYADQVDAVGVDGKPLAPNLGHFFAAWRVDAFRPLDEFQTAMDDLLHRLKSSPKAEGQARIYVAGEKEFEETECRLRDGIPLPKVVLADLQKLGSELGVELNTGEPTC